MEQHKDFLKDQVDAMKLLEKWWSESKHVVIVYIYGLFMVLLKNQKLWR